MALFTIRNSVIISLTVFTILVLGNCKNNPFHPDDPNGDDTVVVDTLWLDYTVWYDSDYKITRYSIADTLGTSLQEIYFNFSDTCVTRRTITDSSESVKVYYLNEDGLAEQSIDSVNGKVLYTYYFYSAGKLNERIDYPVNYVTDSLYESTTYFYTAGNMRTEELCYYDTIGGTNLGCNTAHNDFHYNIGISFPVIDVFAFENGLLGDNMTNLPSEFGQIYHGGPGEGSTWNTYKTFEYEINNDLITSKIDYVWKYNYHLKTIVINRFTYILNK
jgi:hypothetical protein